MTPTTNLTKSETNGHYARVDQAIADLRHGELTPPAFGDQHRNAISACVDGVVSPLSEKIANLRRVLDRIEQAMLQSAARAKVVLDGHIDTCAHLDDDIRRLEASVEVLESKARDQ